MVGRNAVLNFFEVFIVRLQMIIFDQTNQRGEELLPCRRTYRKTLEHNQELRPSHPSVDMELEY